MIKGTKIRPPLSVRTLKPYLPGKPIEELERELGVHPIIKLASNENPFGMSPKACEAASQALQQIARYPDGNGFSLKQALVAHLRVAEECITLGNGSNEILELIARTFVRPKDEVMFWQYAFAVYPLLAQAIGAKPVVIPAHNFQYDLSLALPAINSKTRLIFLANPNNPTGCYATAEALQAFIQAVPPHVLIVIDEAYHEYQLQKDYQTALTWVADHHNLIVTRTFSKAYGLAGLRVGYSISHPEIADYLNRVRQPFNVNSVAQAAAIAALSDADFVNKSVKANKVGMKEMCEALRRLGLTWIPSSANFVTIDFKHPAAPIYEALLHKGVIVRPLQNYGMPHHLRVTIGTPEENQFFIGMLKQVLSM